MQQLIQQDLHIVHSYLMYKKFPYHSVSVIHRQQDLGLHVVFLKAVEHLITDDIKRYLNVHDFTYSII
jgi:hypothetical protein